MQKQWTAKPYIKSQKKFWQMNKPGKTTKGQIWKSSRELEAVSKVWAVHIKKLGNFSPPLEERMVKMEILSSLDNSSN